MKTTASETVGSLMFQGMDAVEAQCAGCGRKWHASIDILPAATTLETVAALLVCAECGGREISVATGRRPMKLN